MKGINVIIPAYNREKYIAQAIDSVLSQDYAGNIEIIISDDGSKDETLNIARSMGNKIKILEKAADCKTQGASGARNRGIKAATQPYICFLDSDDFFLPGHLKKLVTAIESDSNYGFAFCKMLEMYEDNNTSLFRSWTKPDINQRDIENLIVSNHKVVQTNAFIFKREVFDAAGIFNELLRNAEDTDMWMRISELYKGAFSNHFGAVIRKHGQAQLTDIPKEMLLKSHHVIFKNAIKRYHDLLLTDKYRILKLNYIVLKYSVCQLPVFSQLYGVIYKYNMRKNIDEGWYPLSHFTTA